MIEAIDVERTYKLGDSDVGALRGVSLAVAAGDYVAITGPSGSGKSTLMHVLGALDRPTAGVVRIDGRDVNSLGDADLAELRNASLETHSTQPPPHGPSRGGRSREDPVDGPEGTKERQPASILVG